MKCWSFEAVVLATAQHQTLVHEFPPTSGASVVVPELERHNAAPARGSVFLPTYASATALAGELVEHLRGKHGQEDHGERGPAKFETSGEHHCGDRSEHQDGQTPTRLGFVLRQVRHGWPGHDLSLPELLTSRQPRHRAALGQHVSHRFRPPAPHDATAAFCNSGRASAAHSKELVADRIAQSPLSLIQRPLENHDELVGAAGLRDDRMRKFFEHLSGE